MYSGVTKIMPSAARIASAIAITAAGNPFFLDVVVVERKIADRAERLDRDAVGRERRQGAGDRRVIGSLAQAPDQDDEATGLS